MRWFFLSLVTVLAATALVFAAEEWIELTILSSSNNTRENFYFEVGGKTPFSDKEVKCIASLSFTYNKKIFSDVRDSAAVYSAYREPPQVFFHGEILMKLVKLSDGIVQDDYNELFKRVVKMGKLKINKVKNK